MGGLSGEVTCDPYKMIWDAVFMVQKRHMVDFLIADTCDQVTTTVYEYSVWIHQLTRSPFA
jgi:hypothetical protein